ncbi:MAG: chloride channel protein [Acidobacteriota bacterium]
MTCATLPETRVRVQRNDAESDRTMSFFSAGRAARDLDERFRLILVGSLVGAFSGGAAVALTRGLAAGSALLAPARRSPAAFLLPMAGAGLAVIVLRTVFREGGGHGVPEVIYAISRRGGLLRLRSAFSRLISSLLTIISGGSAGPEAPIVISGSSLGSNIATWFGLNDRQRYVIVGCGGAGAISAIFNAPMAGIAFTLEAILGEWTPVHLVPIAMASVVATEVSRLLQGNQIPFSHGHMEAGLGDLAASLGLALLAAAGTVALMRGLRLMSGASCRFIGSPVARAATGGVAVGVLAIFCPQVMGEGYEFVRDAIHGTAGAGLWMVGVLTVAKIVATCLTIGTGGSGGIFAPCLVIGSFGGVFYARLLQWVGWPMAAGGESLFALLGMAGMLSGVLQAPLTGILLILEITGSYNLALPVVLVAVLTATLSQRLEPHSIYHRELIERDALLRPGTDARVLADMNLDEFVEDQQVMLHPEQTLRDVVRHTLETQQTIYPVVDPDTQAYLGLVDTNVLRSHLFDPALHATVLVEQIMLRSVRPLSPRMDLIDVMDRFEIEGLTCLPVVHHGVCLGMIPKLRILEQYRRELILQENR